MASTVCAVALIILSVAVSGNCAAVDRELRKINNRINTMQQNMLQNMNNMQLNIADLEFENRELRKELEGEKTRTSELEIKLNSMLSEGSPAITDTDSRDSTVQEDLPNQTYKRLQEIGNEMLHLDEKVNHLSKSHKHIRQLGVSTRKAVTEEKKLIRKLNETLNNFLDNTTSQYQERRLEIANTLDKIDKRISRNERLLAAMSDCGSHKDIPNGDVSGDSFLGGTPIISCDSGYSQTGSAQCKAPVFWETDVKCQKDCASFHVANGMVTPDASVPHGQTVTVTCNNGYKIVGPKTAVCDNGVLTGGTWCRRISNLTDMVVDSRSSFNVNLEDDDSSPEITGAEFLSDGRLVLCDRSNGKIKLLSSDFTMLDSLTPQSLPWDVSAVDTTTVLITLPGRDQLQYIHVIPQFQASSIIQLDKTCWGIDVVGDEVFTSLFTLDDTKSEIAVYNMDGTLKRRLGVHHDNSYMFSLPYYLYVNPDTGYVYVSDAYTDKVTCLSSAGDVIYQYEDPELDSPVGMYVDDAGNTIVCGHLSHNIHVITVSGKKDKILLTSADGISRPGPVAYRESDDTLVIGGYFSDNLLVFKLKT